MLADSAVKCKVHPMNSRMCAIEYTTTPTNYYFLMKSHTGTTGSIPVITGDFSKIGEITFLV